MSWQNQGNHNPFATPPGMNSGPTRRSNASGGGGGSQTGSGRGGFGSGAGAGAGGAGGGGSGFNPSGQGQYGQYGQGQYVQSAQGSFGQAPPNMNSGPQRRSNGGASGFQPTHNTLNSGVAHHPPPQMRSGGSGGGFNSGAANTNYQQNYPPSTSGYGGGYAAPTQQGQNAFNSYGNSAANYGGNPISPVQQASAFGSPGPASYPNANAFGQPQIPLPQQAQQQGFAPAPALFGQQQIADFQKSAAGQLGMQLGSVALKEGQTIVNQNLNKFVNIPKLKYYFNVSNSYVLNKLRVLVFSFRQKSWTRLVVRSEHSGQMEGFKPPREDLNAPDLYIPIMAFVTYVLTVGITLNSRKKFEPEVLGMTSSTALVIIAFEVLVFKLACYLLNVVTEVPFLDLISYCGYKFVPVLFCLILNLVLPMTAVVYGALAYLIISYSFFTLRSVKYLVLPESSTSTLVAHQRQQRIYLLFVFVGIQALTSFSLFYI